VFFEPAFFEPVLFEPMLFVPGLGVKMQASCAQPSSTPCIDGENKRGPDPFLRGCAGNPCLSAALNNVAGIRLAAIAPERPGNIVFPGDLALRRSDGSTE